MNAIPATWLNTLSKRQLSILIYVLTYQQVYDRPPYITEIASKHLGSSYYTINRDLKHLEALGWLRRSIGPGKRRSIALRF